MIFNRLIRRKFELFALVSIFTAHACQLASQGDDALDPVVGGIVLQAAAVQAARAGDGTCATVSDPLFSNQWHLQNTGQSGGTSGEDANIIGLWADEICGNGITIAVVDDGMEIGHEDLTFSVLPSLSYNYLTAGTDPTSTSNGHGTSVAGVAAARSNSIGLRGAAPLASLAGYNLLQSFTTANQADAMTRNVSSIHVSNNSWGPTDNSGKYDASPALWQSAIETGLSTGRGGLGTIFMWAGGNGGITVDNSNYDGYANYHGVVAICAVGDRGVRANYSELGANLWVCAHSQGDNSTSSGTAITTTDNSGSNGYNNNGGSGNLSNTNYTNTFSGTSSAAPLAAGVVALMLQANPNLTWRDVKLILAESARKNDSGDSDWATNAGVKAGGAAGGYNINHKYGFGTVDANAAVTLARNWTNVGTQVQHTSSLSSPGAAIPDNNATGVSNGITVSGSGITRIEYVDVTVNIAHTYVGDLEVTLTSPSGTSSTLSVRHVCLIPGTITQQSCGAFTGNTWRFGASRYLGESANGTWTITVKDLSNLNTGTFTSWQLKFYGR